MVETNCKITRAPCNGSLLHMKNPQSFNRNINGTWHKCACHCLKVYVTQQDDETIKPYIWMKTRNLDRSLYKLTIKSLSL